MTNVSKKIFYCSVQAIPPRKRKHVRFENQMKEPTKECAIETLRELIARLRLRSPTRARFAPYDCGETTITDSQGKPITLVMRTLFPCGEAVLIDDRELV